VAAVEAAGTQGVDLLIVNKFGPQEAEGRGFCAAIGVALADDVPVLVGVAGGIRAAFDTFACGMAETLPANPEAIRAWVLAGIKDKGAA